MHSAMDDDFDPLAPVFMGGAEEDEGVDDTGSFRDPDGIVTVWFDGQDLTRVRVAFGWQERVGHKGLESHFAAAFALAGSRVAESDPAPQQDPDTSGVDFSGVTRFNADVFLTFQQAFDNFRTQWDQTVTRLSDVTPDGSGPVWGRSEFAAVLINDRGLPERVEFDEEWLEEDAERGDISSEVVAAARHGRGLFHPPSNRARELDSLVRQHEVLMQGLVASVTGKEPR